MEQPKSRFAALRALPLALVWLLAAWPVALWLGHLGRGGFLALNISNVGRAIPTFALLKDLLADVVDRWETAAEVVGVIEAKLRPLRE